MPRSNDTQEHTESPRDSPPVSGESVDGPTPETSNDEYANFHDPTLMLGPPKVDSDDESTEEEKEEEEDDDEEDEAEAPVPKKGARRRRRKPPPPPPICCRRHHLQWPPISEAVRRTRIARKQGARKTRSS